MEPVTHMLTGACLSRAFGWNKRIAHATLAAVIAAELPDADIVYSAGGPLAYFQHHRGWTHSLLWLPLEALITIFLVQLWHAMRHRGWRGRTIHGEPPSRPFALFGICMVALLSHILLDWTNNYGVRPFAPFNPRWYQGEFVFIFEPLIFAALALALLLSPILRLTDREVSGQNKRIHGQGLAVAALLAVLAVWGYRWTEHNRAAEIARAANVDLPVTHVGMNPYPLTPYRWYAIVETPTYFQTGTVDTHLGTSEFPLSDRFYKTPVTPAIAAAKNTRLGRVYLDWAKAPLIDDLGPNTPETAENGAHAVRFRDLRFMFNNPIYKGRENAPLSGTVYVDAQNKVLDEEMNNNAKKR